MVVYRNPSVAEVRIVRNITTEYQGGCISGFGTEMGNTKPVFCFSPISVIIKTMVTN